MSRGDLGGDRAIRPSRQEDAARDQLGAIFHDPAEETEPVEPQHLDVAEDDFEYRSGRQELLGFEAVGRTHAVMPTAEQDLPHRLGERLIVFDEKDAHYLSQLSSNNRTREGRPRAHGPAFRDRPGSGVPPARESH